MNTINKGGHFSVPIDSIHNPFQSQLFLPTALTDFSNTACVLFSLSAPLAHAHHKPDECHRSVSLEEP